MRKVVISVLVFILCGISIFLTGLQKVKAAPQIKVVGIKFEGIYEYQL